MTTTEFLKLEPGAVLRSAWKEYDGVYDGFWVVIESSSPYDTGEWKTMILIAGTDDVYTVGKVMHLEDSSYFVGYLKRVEHDS